MTANSVEYNVVINGILPGNKPGEVAETVAPILGLLPSDALHLFNGVAHTVLQRADLSAAASFQAQLKGLGIDASVAVYQDRTPKPAPAEEQPAAEAAEPEAEPSAQEEEPSAAAEEPSAPVEEAPAPVEAPPVVEEASAPIEEQPEPAAAEEAAAEPVAETRQVASEDEFNLDISLPDEAQTAPEPEAEDIFDAFEKEAAEQKELEELEARQQAAAEPAPEPEPVSEPTEADDFDLDELFDASDDGGEEAPAPEAPKAPKVPELTMADEPDEPALDAAAAVVTENVTAVATGVDAARSLDATPIPNAAPGSNMLCPSCNTLQPRADQCPGCGATVAAPAEETAEPKAAAKPKLEPQLPTAAIGAAVGAAVAGAGLWLGLAYTMDFDTGMFAMVTGVLVGLACGLAGGRGAKAAGTSAALALVAIVGATLMLPKPVTTELPPPPQPDPAEVWSDEKAPQWYKDAFSDAESFMTTDGSAAVVRQFMIDNRYTRATKPREVPESDLRYFYEVDAADLTWIVQTQPDFETWSARMRGHLSGRQRVALNVSAPPVLPPPTGPTPMQIIYMLLGLACAFGLAQVGLRRSA